jgi:hypothetical protein
MLDVDCWDEARDARNYNGPWPVVAHPPCGPWGVLSGRSKEGAEVKSLAPIALSQVREFGGVLEHPIHSRLWREFRLPEPGELPDEYSGRTYEVEQVAFGHKCRKPTRLYAVRVSPQLYWMTLRRGGQPTHQIFGSPKSGYGHSTELRAASAEIRRRTPPLFAEWLVELARSVTR